MDCTKRDQELQGLKKDDMWKPDSLGVIKLVRTDVSVRANVQSDLMLRYALLRRGLALDMADVMAYEVHEEIVRVLMTGCHRAAPSGYAAVTFEQLTRTDKEIFSRLAQ
eukprot:10112622-Heterocapsa_arctica.AAC.1